MAAAAINVLGVDKIYVAGGTWQGSSSLHTVGSQTNIVEVYTPSTNTWTGTSGVAQLLTATSQLTLTAAGGKLWAIGGPGSTTGTVVQIYTLPTTSGGLGSWASGPALPSPRSLQGATVLNGYLYVAGGLQPGNATTAAQATSTVYVIDPMRPTGGLTTWATATPMPVARVAFGGSFGITTTTANPPGYRFIAAGGSLDAGGSITGSVSIGAGQ
jgi:N-acetylneuraminic acid mutarotase